MRPCAHRRRPRLRRRPIHRRTRRRSARRRSGERGRSGQPGRWVPCRRRSTTYQRRRRQRHRLQQWPLPQSNRQRPLPRRRRHRPLPADRRSDSRATPASTKQRISPPGSSRVRHDPAVGHADQSRHSGQRRTIRSAGRRRHPGQQHESRAARVRPIRREGSGIRQPVLGRHRTRTRSCGQASSTPRARSATSRSGQTACMCVATCTAIRWKRRKGYNTFASPGSRRFSSPRLPCTGTSPAPNSSTRAPTPSTRAIAASAGM